MRFPVILLALLTALLPGFLSARPAAAAAAAPVACSPWTQVNENAFGLPDPSGQEPPYASEEGFEVVVFRGALYAGMEADNLLGARVWRTRAGVTAPAAQTDWEEVVADAAGLPFGDPDVAQNDHIDSLAVFNGHLYATTANHVTARFGTQVWRSATGERGSWERVNVDGFGDAANENFKDLQVYDGWLCGGTANEQTGAQVWCTADGATWLRKAPDGFGRTTTVKIWSGLAAGGALYFGAQDRGSDPDVDTDDVARLFRTAAVAGTPAWAEVYTGAPGSFRADLLGELGDHVYLAVRSAGGVVILRSASGDAGSWQAVNVPGMDGSGADNFGVPIDGAAVHGGALYVAVSNGTTGLELWRTAGLAVPGGSAVDWLQVGGGGLGDAQNVHAHLVEFGGDLYAWTSNYATGQQMRRATCSLARNVILFVADGGGAQHLAAANSYTGSAPAYQSWTNGWASTYSSGGGYDPAQAWASFGYVSGGATDSAAAATAFSTGEKTANVRIAVSADGTRRLLSLADKARALGKATGAVSTVQISHATPAGWLSHNETRGNGYALADEALWGDPNTTGLPGAAGYGGGRGLTLPPAGVLLGGGHPGWSGGGNGYVNWAIRDRLAGDAAAGLLAYVERTGGSPDGGARLLAAASAPVTTRLAGLFGGSGGNLEYRRADGSGANPENPTLAQMTSAALAVLSRQAAGFVLLVEGGAVDWAAHEGNMDRMVGEMLGFNDAVRAATDWIEDPATPADWTDTLVIVTADHETGYLTAGPDTFADRPLGPVTTFTLAAEKTISGTGRRAAWADTDNDAVVDAGETVYWAWNSTGHTNSLVRVFARGPGADFLPAYATTADPVRGAYLDNTDIYRMMDAVTLRTPAPPAVEPPASPSPEATIENGGLLITWPAVAGAASYEVWSGPAPYLNPGDPGTVLGSVGQDGDEPGIILEIPSDPIFVAVRAVGAGASAVGAPRVGAFSFALK